MENACRDEPSVLDYSYEPIFGSETTNQMESFQYRPRVIQDQGAESITRMACTRYGITHIINAQDEYRTEHTGEEFEMLLAKPTWERYLKVNPLAEQNGATLQSAVDQFLKDGFITAYSTVLSISVMKDAIRNMRLIYTGSQVGDWAYVTSNRVYRVRTDGRLVGHAFCIIGFDAEGWVAVNSYGENNGLFHIPYDLTDTLFTKYAIIDDLDEEAISNYRKNIMDSINITEAKQAYELGLWNGERATETVTREECAAIVMRALNAQKPA